MISQSRYINIVSGVGAGAGVAQRQLIMRAITQNTTLPPGIVAEFTTLASVGAYFGMMSEEYLRAAAYLSFVSKQVTSPPKISFARWVNTAIAPMIVGDSITKMLASFTSVTAGTLTINDGATPFAVTGLNFSTDTTLTQVATTLQSSLRSVGAGLAAPMAPTTSTVAGGTLAATTYYVKVTYVNAIGETLASAESMQAALIDTLLVVNSPMAETGATGWNVYVSTATGTETKQNTTPINIGTNWTEPMTGLIVGAAVPTSNTTGDSQLTTATVTFNTNTNQFVLSGSVTGSGSLSATPTGLTTDVSGILGWATGGTVLVAGQAADTADAAVAKSAAISNNMGSFIYCTPAVPMSNSDITAVATWNDAQNNMYMYSLATPLANLQTLYALIKGYSGCSISILSTTQPNDYVEQSPCEILAATNYSNVNSVQNFMYYQFPKRNITVSDDITANTVDASRGNYIGVTQSAGQQLAFYQRGVLCGGPAAATDMSTYANEMWLKSAISAQIMSLFLNLPNIPANPTGQGQILGVMQPIATQAVANGTIQIGNAVSPVQQQYISQLTGDLNAWRQVQTLGYWISITFSSYVNANSGLTEWQANYTLVYAKNNAVRAVNGTDIMI